ncbi:DUF3239 domain-containing protein [Corynebacterium qintianiae]|uniref:DUF3239 domain-containing protein n=1 Tax=Corynebacterium qintianiae TaxID=2709392 RepID=A0A7T0KPR2_9CORY|nr:DUF3239 domain-containing protein [Corynebacterium qintianiae]QPK83763.1 DUF3239 domain-containing protein [Corynebacterium qintianiae]
MSAFRFDVDEDWAKQNNEMLRDTRYLVISGVALFVICLTAAVLVWLFVDPASPWHLLGSLGLGLFGVMMLVVGLAIPRSVGTAQSLYDAHPLAPAIIADHTGTRTTLLALVNTTVDDSAPRWALTSRDVQSVPHTDGSVGAKVPVAAVGGQRSAAEKNNWQVVAPMPIAWGTPDKAVVDRAVDSIPAELWRTLETSKKRLEEVQKAKNNLLRL